LCRWFDSAPGHQNSKPLIPNRFRGFLLSEVVATYPYWYRKVVQMAVMAQPWKHPDNGIYYFRREVPQDIRPIIGKREWKVSLKSRDLATVRARFAAESARCEEIFLAAREQLAGRPRVLSSDAPKLADRWARSVLDEWDTDPNAVDSFLVRVGQEGEEHYEPALNFVDEDSARARAAIASPFVRIALERFNLPLPPAGDPVRSVLDNTFFSRWCDLCNMASHRYHGDWTTALPLPAAEKPLTAEAIQNKETHRLPALSLAFEAWAKQKTELDPGSEKTIETFRSTITRFIQLFGDLPLDQIKRKTVQDFMSALLKIPTQGAGIRNLSAPEAILKGEAEGLPTASQQTVKNQLRALGAVLSYAMSRYEGMTEEPVTASGAIKELSRRIKRSPTRFADEKDYNRQELKAIFTSALYTTGWTPPRADYGRALYWLPLLMLYTGARREELAKLYASDIAEDPDTGIRHLRIQTVGEETVKTGNSQRKIPLHRDLIDLGMLDYVESLTAGSRLFPKLEPSKDGYGHSVGKKWAEYLREVVKLDTKADPSHGFRHTFKTLCREAGIETKVSDWITGHASVNVGDTYGSKPLVRMADELKKLPSIVREVGLLK